MSNKVQFRKLGDNDPMRGEYRWAAQATPNGDDRPYTGFGMTRRDAAVDLVEALVFGVETSAHASQDDVEIEQAMVIDEIRAIMDERR